ncbi:MAG: pyridoxal 5'-phosphate synthase glutaminase subunit PdxT [Terriglobia bacterium]
MIAGNSGNCPSGELIAPGGGPGARPWRVNRILMNENGTANNGKTIGILAVQGDFAMHAQMLKKIGTPYRLVKHAFEFAEIAGLILPGGESTTMLKFLIEEKLDSAIRQFAAAGKPIFGTCAGAILLAREVLNPPQERLGLLDITVERNAYGRQIDSSIQEGELPGLADHPVEMVFIRAPVIRRVGEGVRVLGRAAGQPVLVEQGNVLAATFHPELTPDETIHRYFLGKAHGE